MPMENGALYVCDQGWDLKDGSVVCSALGYSTVSGVPHGVHYGEGTGGILLSNVTCNGSEPSLLSCAHNGFYIHHCNHSQD